MKKIILITTFFFIIFFSFGCSKEEQTNNELDYVKGVWWWDNSLSLNYLDFANENNVKEIYYCDTRFNDETINFIKEANSYDIEVYCLMGEYQWINNYENLEAKIQEYSEFQTKSSYKFSGIHFDIEPHQHPEFDLKRNELITSFIEMVIYLNEKYDIVFQYDIPFWIDDIIFINNEKKEAYKWIIDNSDRVVIMSYRDSKESILDIVKEEVEYARLNYKEIMISVETYSLEGDFVSFYEEGKEVMNDVIDEIFTDSHDGIMGIAIHHIESWYKLKP